MGALVIARLKMFDWRSPVPLFAVAVVHLFFFWVVAMALSHAQYQPPVMKEIVARLIAPPSVAPDAPVIEPPRPKPVTPVRQPKPLPSKPVVTPKVEMPPIDSAPRESAISAPAAPEPPAAQVAQAAAPEESAVVTAPQFDVSYLNNPKPTYPALSRRMGEQGKVVLRVSVSVEGLPTDVRLEASSGFPRLDDAAIRAVRNWRFTPARQGNKPVSASVLVPVRFQQDG